MFDVSNALHAWSFSALIVFSWAGNPNKPTVCPTKRPGIHQEWWCNLWQSRFRSYLCAHLTFGDLVREWRQDTADHCLRLDIRTSMTRALVSKLTAFVEVWRDFIVFCSGGLAYTWQWRIDVTLSAANWYMLHKFSGNLWGKYPFLIGIDIFPQCLPTEFHLHYFPVEALFRF